MPHPGTAPREEARRDPRQGRQQLTVGGRGSGVDGSFLGSGPSWEGCALGEGTSPSATEKAQEGLPAWKALCPQLPDLDKSPKLSGP